MSILWTWGKYAIIGLVVAAFVLVFGQPSTTPRPGAVGQVDGVSISREVFELFRDQLDEMREQFLAAGWDEARVRDLVDQRTLDTLIQRIVLVQQAGELGLAVTDEEIARTIRAEPRFHTAGRFDRERFEVFLARSDFDSERTYTDLIRADLLIAKLRRMFESPIRVSRAAVLFNLRREQTELRLRVAAARQSDFVSSVELDAAETAAFAEANPDRLAEAFELRRSEFVQPARVRAAHILFTGEDALERAEATRTELQGGADFSALAAERSADEASAGSGGALGTIPRATMLPEFDEAAFAAEIGVVGPPVRTEHGVHLIRVDERLEPVDRSPDDARLELAADLLRADRATEAARTAAEAMAAALDSGLEFVAAAEDSKLRLEDTPRFKLVDPIIPGVGRPSGMLEAAFALQPAEPPPSRVFRSGSDFFLISLLERHEPDPEELESQIEPMREQLAQRARRDLVTEWTLGRVRQLEREQRIQRFPLYEN